MPVQKHYGLFTKRQVLLFIAMAIIVAMIMLLAIVAYQRALQNPPNIIWALFSGYYRYDPRGQTPPRAMFRERPETSFAYYMDATLKRCEGKYPLLSTSSVTHYQVEKVEYFGHTDYHAFSSVQARLFFANGKEANVTFRFEAGYNEAYFLISPNYPLLATDASVVRSGGWLTMGGLLYDPNVLPPGIFALDPETPSSTSCSLSPPLKVEWAGTH